MTRTADRRHQTPLLLFCVLLTAFVLCSQWMLRPRVSKDPRATSDVRSVQATNGVVELVDNHRRTHKRRVSLFVGVQTGFSPATAPANYDYTKRRDALRGTWFPATAAALDELESKASIAVRFVIGHSSDAAQEAAIEREHAAHGGFLRLDLLESYENLTHKSLLFFKTVAELYDFEYLFKVDDDVFMRLDRLPQAVHQWHAKGADYVGCMKRGGIQKDKNYRWFEPQHALLGDEKYFTHTWGTAYVLSSRAVAAVGSLRTDMLRFFANEDVTVGSWMLVFNMTHWDDRRMCETTCSASSIVVFDMPACAGLCNAVEQLPTMWSNAACRPTDLVQTSDLPQLPPIIVMTD